MRRRLIIWSLVLLLVPFVMGYGRFTSFGVSLAFHAALGVIITLLAFWGLKPLDQGSVDSPAEPFGPAEQVVDDHVVDTILEKAGAERVVSREQAKFFLLVLTSPAEVRKRIVDSYRLEERTVRQTVTIDAQIPRRVRFADGKQTDDQVYYFPLLVPPKGKLLDGWRVMDGAGDELPNLTYREYLLVAVSVLRMSFVTACEGQPDVQANGLTPHASKVERQAVKVLLARNTRNQPVSAEKIKEVADRIRTLPSLPNGNKRTKAVRDAREVAAKLVEKLGPRYAVVAVLRAGDGGRFLAKYEQTLIPDLQLAHEKKWVNALIGSKSVALGARPVDLTVGIENASTCQSYHLIIEGSDGSYLGRQEAIDFTDTLRLKARGAPTMPHARFRQRLGQPYGHFYVRYFPEPAAAERPRIRFQYFEVPPGSLLRAAVTALASFFLVWVISIATRDIGQPGVEVPTDAPAVLLAFPALAATWLGFDKRTNRLLEGTFLARVCLLVTAFVSIAAAALFMLHKVKPAAFTGLHLPENLSLLWITDISWVILLAAALVNALVVCYRYVVETWKYCHLSGRTQPLNQVFRRV